jgi:hypothetical protein
MEAVTKKFNPSYPIFRPVLAELESSLFKALIAK